MIAADTIAAVAPSCAGVSPPQQGHRVALWLLSSAVVATVAGMAAATFRGDGTALNAFLFLSLEWPHVAAGRVERAAMSVALAAAVAGMFWRRWPVLLPVAAYVFAEALCRRQQGGQIFSEWALLAHAPRYATPLALLVLAMAVRTGIGAGRDWQVAGEWILRVAVAIVFAVHGVECIKGHPHFIDLVLSSAANLGGFRIREATALVQMEWIGILDCVVAGALLLRPHPAVLLWAAFWGAVSALSRVTANGWGAYPDVLVRMTHVLVPLALLFLRRRTAELPAQAGAPAAACARP